MRRPLTEAELAAAVLSAAGPDQLLALGMALGRSHGGPRAIDCELLDRLAALPPRNLHLQSGRAEVLFAIDNWADAPEE